MITAKDSYPIEVQEGISIRRSDLETHFDEADYIIQQQVDAAVHEGALCIKVKSADTDVFVLLCSNYLTRNWASANSWNLSWKVRVV